MPERDVASQDKLIKNFDSILDLIPDGIYISDKKGTTLKINEPYERLTGIDASAVIGKNVYDLQDSGVFDTIVNPEVVATGKPATSVQEVNGLKVVLRGFPVYNARGGVELCVTFVRDITQIDRLRREVAAQRELVDAYQRQMASLNPEAVFQKEGMIAVSSSSLDLLKALDNIAPTDAVVLILGETGVGKDVLARQIHKKSLRVEKPYLKVDCTAIPESLVESELFGYEPGAFSGARSKGKQGLFEMANGGTLFLDEIGELSLPMQTKLLRAIQDQEIIRVGATSVKPIDVRIVAATNRGLEEEVKKGRFRSDLYYRLKVAVLHILPLRERRDDILPLARVFLHRFNEKYRKDVCFNDRVENVLLNYGWPGNVRELENTIHSIVVTATKSRISCRDLPDSMASKCDASASADALAHHMELGRKSLKEIVQSVERSIIAEAMELYGSSTKAAEALQVNRSTLFRKMGGAAEEVQNGKRRG
ncbi:sigma-54 interaction domain-containing protein [Desulfocurvus sp. DL9XJH121]